MSIDKTALTGAIIDAARATAGRRWRTIRPLVEMEARKLAQTVEDVGNLLARKAVDRQRARSRDERQDEPAGPAASVRSPQLSRKFKAGKDL